MPNDELALMKAELADLREFRKATEKRLYLLETAMKKAPAEPAAPVIEAMPESVPEPQPAPVEEDSLVDQSETDDKPSKDKSAK